MIWFVVVDTRGFLLAINLHQIKSKDGEVKPAALPASEVHNEKFQFASMSLSKLGQNVYRSLLPLNPVDAAKDEVLEGDFRIQYSPVKSPKGLF
jgi:hypothetical protein